MHFKPSHLLVLSALLLEACAGVPAYEGLPPAAKDQIASTEVVLPIKQSEIYVYVPPSNVAAATGGGLLPALIDVAVDTVRTDKAEAAVKPLRNALIDYSFDASMQMQIKSALNQVAWLHVDDVRLSKDVSGQTLDRTISGAKESAVMLASSDYQLSNDGDVLTVSMSAALYPNTDSLRALRTGRAKSSPSDLANAIYHNTLTFSYRLPAATADRDTNIALWSKDNGAPMRKALDASSAKLAWLLSQDLQSTMTGTPVPAGDANGMVGRMDNGTLKYTANSLWQ